MSDAREDVRAGQDAETVFCHNGVERVRSYYRMVDAGDVDGLLGLFAEHATYRRPGYAPLHGRRGLRTFYEGDRVIERGRHSLSSVTAQRPRVAVTGHFEGVLKDGSKASLEFADFFELAADGLFVKRETFFFTPLV